MTMIPYVYVDTRGASRDFTRSAPAGTRVAVHYPELGRTVELEADMHGRWTVTERPAPGHDGDIIPRGRGDVHVSARLEYLRRELRGERISLGELMELANLREHIAPGDVELLEAAGVPEFPEHDGDSEEASA